MSIHIDPQKKYNKKEVMELLEYTPKQLEEAEKRKLVIFQDGNMYGIYFFQFLTINCSKLEQIKGT
jgi:hypothetical protein